MNGILIINLVIYLRFLLMHIVKGHIPPWIACVFGATCFLAMTKPLDGVHPILVEETLYRLTSCTLCFQFHDVFATHFSSHQFRVAIKGGCVAIIHGIRCTLDLYPNWVVLQLNVANAFNSISRGVIFKNFMHRVETSLNSSLLFVHSMHLNLLYFIAIIIMNAMSQSSFCHGNLLRWSLGKGTIRISPF
jgi:hypothetical protein